MPPKPTYDRDALINRARDLFWAQGWAGTSLKDLEAALDMRPGSFYAAFGSKAALYGLTLERYGAEGVAHLQALAATEGPLAALRAHMRSFVEPSDRPSALCFLVRSLSELAPQGGPLAAQAEALLDAAEAGFADLFRRAQEVGDVAPHHDPVRLARRYQAQLTGLRAAAQRSPANAAALVEDFDADLAALAAAS